MTCFRMMSKNLTENSVRITIIIACSFRQAGHVWTIPVSSDDELLKNLN